MLLKYWTWCLRYSECSFFATLSKFGIKAYKWCRTIAKNIFVLFGNQEFLPSNMPNPISGSSVIMRIVLLGKQIMVDDDEIPDEKSITIF